MDDISPTTATLAVDSQPLAECNATNAALPALGQSNATNPLGRGLAAREARVARGERTKHRASNRLSTAIRQYSLTPTASRKSTRLLNRLD